MTYKQWLEGDCGCGNVSPCSHKDVCDCENILLELEKQHVDDLTLQDEIDYVSGVVETISGCTGGSVIVDEELSLTSTNPVQNKVITGALNGKLDSSAYTPTQYTAGEYITIDSANTISTSGLVTVVDNEVPAFSAENLVMYNSGYPSSGGYRYDYSESADAIYVYFSIGGSLYRYNMNIQVVDTGGTKTSGETGYYKASQITTTNINPLPDYLTVENVANRKYIFRAKDGYRISHLSSRITYDGSFDGYEYVYLIDTPTSYSGGQSEYTIENVIYPELAKKANKIQAGNAISIIKDTINNADTIRVNTSVVSDYNSGSTLPPTTKSVYNELKKKQKNLQTGNGITITTGYSYDTIAVNTASTIESGSLLIPTAGVVYDALSALPTNVSAFINDAGYITNSELIQYITNLQQQINSLTSAISGCCGESGETQYRWITMTGENDYWCSGTTKYSKEKEQSSTDGIVWSDTGNIRNGNTVLEENCVDCGYTPISQNANISLGYDLINDLSGQTTYKISNSCESNVNYINVCVHSAEGNFCDNNRTCSTSITKNELDAIHMPTSQWPLRTFGVRINKTDGLIKSYEYYNSDFKDVTLYSGVTSIGDYAFANNQYLVSAGRDQYSGTMYLTSIGNYAFANNPLLTTINLWGLGSGVPTLGTGAFDNCPNLAHIYVDSSLVNAFKTAPGWSAFANIIESGT